MKILLYNYVQPGERNNPGGGVSIYLNNLIVGLRHLGHEVFILSAGDRYDFFSGKPRIDYDKAKETLILYNSPVLAPAHYAFHHPEIYLDSSGLDHIPRKLYSILGAIDVAHFHNIEGLTKSFFIEFKKAFSSTALIYSAHNYSTVCPQVALWKQGSEACTDYEDGFSCTNCTGEKDLWRRKIIINRLKSRFKEPKRSGTLLTHMIYRVEGTLVKAARQLLERNNRQSRSVQEIASKWAYKAPSYRRYRAENILLMNDVFDKTVAVSRRTRQILFDMGVSDIKMAVSYIGTRHYEAMASSTKKLPTSSNLHIAYFGYMRKEKGFFFFLDCLEALPADILAKIHITVAARFTSAIGLQRLEQLRKVAGSLSTYDGYTQGSIKDMLQPVNLGIVPPLWEDNLPQVAIEFVCNGVPILTSQYGGAQEVANRSEFTFDTSTVDGLVKKITAILNGDFNMATFWDADLNLRSVSAHTRDVVSIYESVLRAKGQDVR